MNENFVIVFDTETTGLNPEKSEIVQLSYILYDIEKKEVVYATTPRDDIVKISGKIPPKTTEKHGIVKEMTLDKRPIKDHIDEFIYHFNQAATFIGHNVGFDIRMIVGQINKIIAKEPEAAAKYREFLGRFNNLDSYCTMKESKGLCAKILNQNKIKNKSLKDVHELIFNQEVRGQLHNSLVDVAVTLRIYLKLTRNIDICERFHEYTGQIDNITNDYIICNLINPYTLKSDEVTEIVNYSGEVITGYTVLPDNTLEENEISIKTTIHNMAEKFVSDITQQGISRATSTLINNGYVCKEIIICKAILVSGTRKGEQCGRLISKCQYHKKPKSVSKNTIQPDTIQPDTIQPNTIQPDEQPDAELDAQFKPKTKTKTKKQREVVSPYDNESAPDLEKLASRSFLSKILGKTRKVVPEGGRKRRRIKTAKKRKTLKKRKNRKY